MFCSGVGVAALTEAAEAIVRRVAEDTFIVMCVGYVLDELGDLS